MSPLEVLKTMAIFTQGVHHLWHIKDFTTHPQFPSNSSIPQSNARFSTMAVVQFAEPLPHNYLLFSENLTAPSVPICPLPPPSLTVRTHSNGNIEKFYHNSLFALELVRISAYILLEKGSVTDYQYPNFKAFSFLQMVQEHLKMTAAAGLTSNSPSHDKALLPKTYTHHGRGWHLLLHSFHYL